MNARDSYLAQVAAELPLPAGVRDEVLEELSVHVGDTIDDLVSRGRDASAAEAEAIARLGPPQALAMGLARAHRERTRVLAAAGAGAWAAIRVGFAGWLVASLLIVLAWIGSEVVLRRASEWFGLQMNVQLSGGWNTVLTATAMNIGALLAGAAAVAAVARSTWQRPEEVRAAVIVVGGLVLAWFDLVLVEQPLNWASVIAFLLVPVSFGAGAFFEHLRLPRPRFVAVVALLGLLSLGVAGVGATSSNGASSYQWTTTTHGYEMIAPWWQDPANAVALDFPSGDSTWMGPGIATISVDAASPAVAARFHDYRLEAWRAETPQDGWRLLPGQHQPFASVAASVDGTTVSGTLVFNGTPGLDWAEVVLTAAGPDGRRYLISASGPQPTQFYGSVASWFQALGR